MFNIVKTKITKGYDCLVVLYLRTNLRRFSHFTEPYKKNKLSSHPKKDLLWWLPTPIDRTTIKSDKELAKSDKGEGGEGS
jgi:hypothetical protein